MPFDIIRKTDFNQSAAKAVELSPTFTKGYFRLAKAQLEQVTKSTKKSRGVFVFVCGSEGRGQEGQEGRGGGEGGRVVVGGGDSDGDGGGGGG